MVCSSTSSVVHEVKKPRAVAIVKIKSIFFMVLTIKIEHAFGYPVFEVGALSGFTDVKKMSTQCNDGK